MKLDTIPTQELKRDLIPLPDAPIREIDGFALTFDPLEVYQKVPMTALEAEIAQMTLLELRYMLFYEQRRWNHFGRPYDASTESQLRKAIRRMRELTY